MPRKAPASGCQIGRKGERLFKWLPLSATPCRRLERLLPPSPSPALPFQRFQIIPAALPFIASLFRAIARRPRPVSRNDDLTPAEDPGVHGKSSGAASGNGEQHREGKDRRRSRMEYVSGGNGH